MGYGKPLARILYSPLDIHWRIIWMYAGDDQDYLGKLLIMTYQYHTQSFINWINDR